MKRVWGHVLAGLAVTGGACALLSAACTHDDSTIFVQDVLAQQLVTNGQVCVFTADPTQAAISSGTLDLDLRDQYDAEILVGNQMTAQANSAQLVTETSIVNIRSAVVRITDSSGTQLTSYTRDTSATIPAAQSGTPGYAPLNLTIIDHDTIANDPTIQNNIVKAPANQKGTVRLVSNVKFIGRTLGGQSVESNEFSFPVDICQGCLISVSQSDINPACPYLNCFGATGSTTQLPVPCFPGQDFAIDCSQCQGVAACRLDAPPGATSANCLAGDAGTD